MNKRIIYWTCQIGGWLLYAIINIYFTYLAGKINPEYLITQVFLMPFSIIITHTFRIYIIQNRWLIKRLPNLIPSVLIANLIMSAVHYLFLLMLSVALGILNPGVDLIPFVVFMNILANTILYFIWTMIYFMYHYVESYNRSLKYEAAMHEMELNYLKSQLNPHFIFNALNSVRALIDDEPQKAKTAITQLSNILRNSLITDKKRLISFKEELKTVIDFLELEKIRYEERLEVSYDIHPDSNKFQIPPLMLQTIVENGIKHGIARLTQGGSISLKTHIDGAYLHILINNSGQYHINSRKKRKGFGIDNTKQRLKIIFGNEASFDINNINGNTVQTRIIIPQNI